jgi:anti-sigma B factor antagonist
MSLAVVSFAGMNIDVRKSSDVIIVDFSGRLAVGVSDEVLPQVINELLSEGHKKILLNLSDVDYIDSNGLGELVQALKAAGRHGASLRLLNPQDRVRKTLKLTNLLPMFLTHQSEPDALSAFANEQIA